MNHALVFCRKDAKGPAAWLMSSPCFTCFPSVSIHPSFCCAGTSPLHFHTHQISVCAPICSVHFLSSMHVFPALHCDSWVFVPLADATLNTWLWEELVRRCELNPWLISEHDTVREPRYSANTSSDGCVCVRQRESWGLGGDQEHRSERKRRRRGDSQQR